MSWEVVQACAVVTYAATVLLNIGLYIGLYIVDIDNGYSPTLKGEPVGYICFVISISVAGILLGPIGSGLLIAMYFIELPRNSG